MKAYRLMERIHFLEKNPKWRDMGDSHDMLRSIINHLQRILNTFQGSAQIAEDLGIPDITHFLRTIPDSVQSLENSIKRTIQNYEPRLKHVKVRYNQMINSDLCLSFQITGQIDHNFKRYDVNLESLIGTDGKIRIQE
jgi:type VI secretion system protein